MSIALDDAQYLGNGTYRAACPHCNRSKRDAAVAVSVAHGTALWYCHRCGVGGRLGRAPTGPQRVTQTAQAGQRWSDLAERLWRRSRPLTGTDVASRYLHNRACVLPEGDDVRWLPDEPPRYCYPSVVARITDARTGDPMSLHFTDLRHDSTGKAPGDMPRRLLGGHVKKGGVIRLSADDSVTHGLAIAEGIETALAVARVHRPIWSCIDASGVAAFPTLDGIEALTIFADADDAGRKAAESCAARWYRAGREVYIAEPPAGDWSDRAQQAVA